MQVKYDNRDSGLDLESIKKTVTEAAQSAHTNGAPLAAEAYLDTQDWRPYHDGYAVMVRAERLLQYLECEETGTPCTRTRICGCDTCRAAAAIRAAIAPLRRRYRGPEALGYLEDTMTCDITGDDCRMQWIWTMQSCACDTCRVWESHDANRLCSAVRCPNTGLPVGESRGICDCPVCEAAEILLGA